MDTKKVAFVTGASSGMGKDTAKKLLQDGFVVYVAARRLEKMKDLEALGAIPIQMDISKEDDIVKAVEQITSTPRRSRCAGQQCGFWQLWSGRRYPH